MLKTLIKKQLLELNSFYFQDRKTGKRRTNGGIIGYGILYAFIFLGLGFAFYGLASMVGTAMIPAGLDWLYYVFMGLVSLFLGVFGGVFNTYASLYLAKDNEALMSMPIPPSYILLSRLVGVFSMSLFYMSLVYIPTILVYLIIAGFSALAFINAVLSLLLLGLLATVICCILGWLIAIISVRLKNKSFVTVLISLVFFAAYYMFYGNYYMLIQELLANLDNVSSAIKGKAYPLYIFGSAAAGRVVPMLIFALFVIAAIALTVYVLSASFLKITSIKGGSSTKAEFKERSIKVSGMGKALFVREFKRFTSSATYMLNCALGSILMPVGGIAMLFFLDDIRDVLSIFAAPGDGFLVVLVISGICTACSMIDITAPSISLEGKNIWIVQSMPVSPSAIFDAKKRVHLVMAVPSMLIFTLALCIVIEADAVTMLLAAVYTVCHVMLTAALGLVLNLKMPNLSWTNETAPIKQSMPGMLCLFGGWLLAVIIAFIGYYAVKVMSGTVFLALCIAVTAILSRLLNNWLIKSGSRIFAEL